MYIEILKRYCYWGSNTLMDPCRSKYITESEPLRPLRR